MKALLPRIVAVALWCTAIFPLIRWWYRRLAEPFETSQWAALALCLLLALTWWTSTRRTATLPLWKLYLAAGGVLSFGILYSFLPLTLAVCPALLAGLPLLLPEDSPQGPFPPALATLGFLILPSAMIIELFLGVPLRALAVSGAAILLRLGGFEIVQRGFELTVNGQSIWVDAPCAGVRMLSTGAGLACICAYLFHLNSRRTLALGGLSLFLILVCNCARVTILSVCESFGSHLSPSTHSLVGLIALAPGIVTIALTALALERLSIISHKKQIPPALFTTSHYAFRLIPGFICLSIATAICIVHRGSVPISQGSVPISQGSVPISRGSVPISRGSVPTGSGSVPTASSFPGWPREFEGQSLTELPLDGKELSFSGDFPGKIGRFKAGNKIVILRWTDRTTHRVHSASTCLAATGWQVTPLPLLRRPDGDWSSFSAQCDGNTLTIREQIRSADGKSMSDVPTWFVQSLLGKTRGPWWIITVTTPDHHSNPKQ